MTHMDRRIFCVDARMLFSSGIGTVIQNVIRRLPPGRWDYRFLVADERSEKWVREHLPTADTALVTDPIYSLAEQVSVPRAARRADLFWSPHYDVPIFFRGHMVATVHDVLHLARPDFFPGLVKQTYARILLQAVKFRCRRVVCVSEFTAREFQRFSGTASSQIRVVPNGVDAAWFDAAQSCELQNPYFIFVGNVKPHKNLLLLLKAFEQVMAHIPHKLIIVGQRDGFITGDPRIETYASRLGDRVQFTGWLDDVRLRQWVAQATALVFPSLYEGFGLPMLEAMACGCPVLSSSAASLPEVGGPAATYFDPESVDEIAETLLKASSWTAEERQRLIQLGKARARLFSWDKSMELLLKVFEEATA